MLKTAYERESHEATTNSEKNERAVFFDYLSLFMIYYSRRAALVLHNIPLAIFFIMPVLLHLRFAHPYLAFIMFIPCALFGLSIPRVFWSCFPLSQDASVLQKSKEALSVEARFWGAFGLYAILSTAYLVSGLSGGFLSFVLSASMLLAWILFCFAVKSCGHQSLRATMFYVIPQIPFLAYSVYFGGFLVQFLVEKMGMMGSVPPPFGYFIPDIVVAAIIGVVTGWCVGPLLPVCGHWLARRSVMHLLLHLTFLGLAFSSRFFPYTNAAPKRVIFQHTFVTSDLNQVIDSSYDLAVVDSNSLLFLFKHAPEVAKELKIGPEFSFETAKLSHRETWMALYPVSFLFSRSVKFPEKSDDVLKQYRQFPLLSTHEPHTTFSKETRRIHLELSLGSLKEVWVAVLNITGPLSGWSFADNVVPAPEIFDGGPPSYICRLSGASHENWTFWLEASNGEDLRVEVAVLDQHMVDASKKLKGLFPDWVDVIAYSSFLSSYVF
ncbi:hypothetical protein TIFTF001_018385 [Ficus carica]|uniref:Endoplasmic reticulum metallopeptidase 1-like C-terminal domain-containing protein n=1 Tax=Ficus carica TaxID=3494 RepID=A0AA88DAQ1_FICCA|nr:hypothetical protein TIFTF001_018385 [Ficus carica]